MHIRVQNVAVKQSRQQELLGIPIPMASDNVDKKLVIIDAYGKPITTAPEASKSPHLYTPNFGTRVFAYQEICH
jgi:hypothetical protein